MAITPRILFTQPASAAVAAITLFGLSVLATATVHDLRREEALRPYASPCSDLREQMGPKSMWSEAGWVRYAYCFDANNDSPAAATVALDGLQEYPHSETLYNIAGYHLIEMGSYRAAVTTLERGLRTIGTPSNGVMENNLAWAYLWIGEGSSDAARGLVLASLSRDPQVCETIHTGLFVEFERARSTVGLDRAEALKSYQMLRNRYTACEHREETWENLIETTGAAVLDVEVESMLDTGFRAERTNETLRVAADRLDDYGSLASPLCAKAIPMSDLRDDCQRAITSAR